MKDIRGVYIVEHLARAVCLYAPKEAQTLFDTFNPSKYNQRRHKNVLTPTPSAEVRLHYRRGPHRSDIR